MVASTSQPQTEGGLTPVPDPTILSTEALHREIRHLREQIEARLDGMKDVTDERFTSVSQRFTERDIRSEREARDNKVAVDAAFAAQKEAAAKQDEANQKAIDKSEKATDEKIVRLEQLFRTTTDALGDKIDDDRRRQSILELAVNGQVQNRTGGQEQKSEFRSTTAALVGIAGLAVVIITFVINYAVR